METKEQIDTVLNEVRDQKAEALSELAELVSIHSPRHSKYAVVNERTNTLISVLNSLVEIEKEYEQKQLSGEFIK